MSFYRSLQIFVPAAFGLLLSTAPAAAECDLKIGALGPLSGGAAAWGTALRSGAELAAAEVNRDGGLQIGADKCHVTVVPYDSKYSAEAAAAGANTFAGQDIKFIVGPIGSPEVTGVRPVAARNQQITFGTAYAKDALSPQFPLHFQQLPGPRQWAPPLAKLAKDTFDIKSVVVVAPNDQGGTDIASVDAEAYRGIGIDAKEEYYQRGTTNFAPLVTRILNAQPGAVDTASSPPGDAATMVKQLRQAGFQGPIGRLGGPGTQEIVKAVGGLDILKDFYWLEIIPVDDPKVKGLWDEYKQLMGSAAIDNTIFGTAAAASRMLLRAISKAGTMTDAIKVAEVLRALPVDDPNLGKGVWTGQQIFGVNQELTFSSGFGLIKDGKNLGVRPVQLVNPK
jgi:branched-chain amino acid transport system substrate-binding protein